MIARPSCPYALNRAGVLVILSTGCLAAALVGPLVATSATATYGIAALLVIAGLLAVSARQPAGLVLVIGVVVIAALNDVPQRLHVGPTTGQGVETLALLAIMVLVCLNGYAAGGRSRPSPVLAAGAVRGLVRRLIHVGWREPGGHPERRRLRRLPRVCW